MHLTAIFPQSIYQTHLKVIESIKFTQREVDIISCIVNGNVIPFQIAKVLTTDIAKPLGVEGINTHIQNIRRKIEGGSRDTIRVFIEKSSKCQTVKEYYKHLLRYNAFIQSLSSIKQLINANNVVMRQVAIVLHKLTQDTEQSSSHLDSYNEIHKLCADYLTQHLESLGIGVSIETRERESLDRMQEQHVLSQ